MSEGKIFFESVIGNFINIYISNCHFYFTDCMKFSHQSNFIPKTQVSGRLALARKTTFYFLGIHLVMEGAYHIMIGGSYGRLKFAVMKDSLKPGLHIVVTIAEPGMSVQGLEGTAPSVCKISAKSPIFASNFGNSVPPASSLVS